MNSVISEGIPVERFTNHSLCQCESACACDWAHVCLIRWAHGPHLVCSECWQQTVKLKTKRTETKHCCRNLVSESFVGYTSWLTLGCLPYLIVLYGCIRTIYETINLSHVDDYCFTFVENIKVKQSNAFSIPALSPLSCITKCRAFFEFMFILM